MSVVVCFGWADLREKNQEPIAKEEPLEDIVSSVVLGSGLGLLLELFMFWLKIGVVLCVVLFENCQPLGPLLPCGKTTVLLLVFRLIATSCLGCKLLINIAPLLG